MATLTLSGREKLGTRAARRLRAEGLVPGIIYGHGEANRPVAMARHDIELAIQHGERLIRGEVSGKQENFLIKDVQYDYLGQNVLHVDLARVRLDERVEVTVPIELRGTPVGVDSEDGVLTKLLPEVRLECVVTSIPEEIRASVAALHVNESLRVADLELPEGVKVLEEPETVIASVTVVAEEEAAPAEEAPEVAEPEVIGEKPAEEEATGKPQRERD